MEDREGRGKEGRGIGNRASLSAKGEGNRGAIF